MLLKMRITKSGDILVQEDANKGKKIYKTYSVAGAITDESTFNGKELYISPNAKRLPVSRPLEFTSEGLFAKKGLGST